MSTIQSDADVVPERRRRRGAYHKPEVSSRMTKAQMKPTKRIENPDHNYFATWKTPLVEKQSILQLHCEDDYRRRREQ